ncbi:hypothetical protein [Asticcacaulis sp. AND118]|uniref:hypothetical protein n=1 Tax=Asticcacaulis sp. AND118 TaxID=2840468 RepID=UPI001CFFBC26|nr:hypothetical protein [Asticcacaulis sp. AND118]UDF04063.1 hypothetical protein LH365_03175 [Asticcacaulis sp. AND118]
MTKTIYLDQNAWVALAKGAWDKTTYPREHAALVMIGQAVEAGSIRTPLSFTNQYETMKVNVPQQRLNLALTQASLSGGRVFRGRRRILTETLSSYLADRMGIERVPPSPDWYLSDIFFEAVADYTPETFGMTISDKVLNHIRSKPAEMLFDYLAGRDDQNRREGVQFYTAMSNSLISNIEGRRAAVAQETLAVRRRAYSAVMVIDVMDVLLATGRSLGLQWHRVTDIGASLTKAIINDIPVLNTEREIAVRLEDQARALTENDLRDMNAFATVLPLADIMVAEKQFGNLAKQAGLDKAYQTKIFRSVFDLTPSDFQQV